MGRASDAVLPEDVRLVRTTDHFDQHSVPAGLRRAHRTAPGVWGRLVVRQGSLSFQFEDEATEPVRLDSGESVVIPPQRPHRVIVGGPVGFVVEFYRAEGHGGG